MSSIARVSIERLSIVILPWLGASLLVPGLITSMSTGITLVSSYTFTSLGRTGPESRD